MKRNTKIIIACLALLAAAGVMMGVWLALRPEVSEGVKEITVEAAHSDGSVKSFTYKTSEEYLGAVLLSDGLAEGEQGEYGLYITSVDGERAVYEEDGAYWALYRNGEYAVSGADTTPIADGDVLRPEYTR